MQALCDAGINFFFKLFTIRRLIEWDLCSDSGCVVSILTSGVNVISVSILGQNWHRRFGQYYISGVNDGWMVIIRHGWI